MRIQEKKHCQHFSTFNPLMGTLGVKGKQFGGGVAFARKGPRGSSE
jgi:hypothetical protein